MLTPVVLLLGHLLGSIRPSRYKGPSECSADLAVYLHANSLQFPIAVERLLGNTGINKEPCVNHGLSRNCKYRKQL